MGGAFLLRLEHVLVCRLVDLPERLVLRENVLHQLLTSHGAHSGLVQLVEQHPQPHPIGPTLLRSTTTSDMTLIESIEPAGHFLRRKTSPRLRFLELVGVAVMQVFQ